MPSSLIMCLVFLAFMNGQVEISMDKKMKNEALTLPELTIPQKGSFRDKMTNGN